MRQSLPSAAQPKLLSNQLSPNALVAAKQNGEQAPQGP